jgi:hypothetical protein
LLANFVEFGFAHTHIIVGIYNWYLHLQLLMPPTCYCVWSPVIIHASPKTCYSRKPHSAQKNTVPSRLAPPLPAPPLLKSGNMRLPARRTQESAIRSLADMSRGRVARSGFARGLEAELRSAKPLPHALCILELRPVAPLFVLPANLRLQYVPLPQGRAVCPGTPPHTIWFAAVAAVFNGTVLGCQPL